MSERPAPRLRTVDRQQIIPAMPLEDLLDTDHQARLVWHFCLGLDLTPLYDSIRSRVGGPGHPAIDPRLCVALWLYATLEGVGSARALAWLCENHNAFRWLTGGVPGNHQSLSDCRVGDLEFLDDLPTQPVPLRVDEQAARTAGQVVVGVTVKPRGGDMGQLAPLLDQVEERSAARPQEALADGGLANHDDIKRAQRKGTTVYVPVPEPKDPKRDR